MAVTGQFAFAQDAPAPPAPPPAQAPAPSSPPPTFGQSLGFGAVVFYDYTVTREPKSTDADGNTFTPSAFNLTRSYINITGNVSRTVSFRVTPDITRDSDTGSLGGNLVFRIKYAYAQISFDQWTGAWRNTWVRLGVQQTPYIDYAEGIYRYRFQGTTFTEREQIGGNLTSSDAGASFHTTLPGDIAEVHAGVYNGEGYSKAETNDQKAVQIRGTVRPAARSSGFAHGLRLTVFYDADHYFKDAERTRLVTAGTFEHRRFNAGVEYLRGQDQPSINQTDIASRGWSVWVTPFLHEKGNGLEALLRFDRFKPDVTTSGRGTQEKQRAIAGLAYWFPHPGGNATAALLLDVEQVKFANFDLTRPANATQQRIALHGLINF